MDGLMVISPNDFLGVVCWLQEPPKSFTEWFDGIGVVPKVW